MRQESFKNINLLKWFNLCADFRLYSPIAVLYFETITNSYAEALLILSFAMFATAAFELPTGVFSDIYGRKKALIAGQLAEALSILIYCISGTFWMLALAAILHGLCNAFFSGNNSALLYDSLKENNLESEYPKWEGRNSSMLQFALGSSALIAGLLLYLDTSKESYKVLFFLSVIPQVIGLAIAFRVVEPRSHSDRIKNNPLVHVGQALAEFRGNIRLRTLSIISILDMGLGQANKYLFPFFTATLWPVWAIPFANFVKHLLVALGLRMSHIFIKKFGATRLMLAVKSVNDCVQIYFTALPNFFSPLTNLLEGFLWGLGNVAQNNLLQKEFSDKQRATMGSLNSLGGAVLFSILAYVLGLLADSVGPAKALLLANILSFTSIFFYWRLFKHKG